MLTTAAVLSTVVASSTMQAMVGMSNTNATANLGSCDPSSLISKHEGSKTCSYTDTTGHKTVGVGFNMDAVSSSKWSSICSSCPSYSDVYSGAKCISSSNVNTLLQYSLRDAKAEAARVVSNYGSMCCNVQNVVTDMTFNLGSLSGFPTLVRYFESSNWAAAASDMKTTLWCRQVGSRCTEDAAMVAQGC
jgi:lysozyme